MSRRDLDPVAITIRRGNGVITQGVSVENFTETINRLAAVVPADAEWTSEVRCPGLAI